MTVTEVKDRTNSVKGVPDYYKIYIGLLQKYLVTGDPETRSLAYHYARVAQEMKQATIDDADDKTDEIITFNR